MQMKLTTYRDNIRATVLTACFHVVTRHLAVVVVADSVGAVLFLLLRIASSAVLDACFSSTCRQPLHPELRNDD